MWTAINLRWLIVLPIRLRQMTKPTRATMAATKPAKIFFPAYGGVSQMERPHKNMRLNLVDVYLAKLDNDC